MTSQIKNIIELVEAYSAADSAFGKWMKEIRKGLKLTQSEFSEKIGVTAMCVCLLEKGTTRPTPDTVHSFLDFLRKTFQ